MGFIEALENRRQWLKKETSYTPSINLWINQMGKIMRKFDFIDKKRAICESRKRLKISVSSDYSIGFHSFLHLCINHALCTQNCAWCREKRRERDTVHWLCLQQVDGKCTQCLEGESKLGLGHKGSHMLG